MFPASFQGAYARFANVLSSRRNNSQQGVVSPQVSHQPTPDELQDAINTSAAFTPPAEPTLNTVWVARKKQAQPSAMTLRELPGDHQHWIQSTSKPIKTLKSQAENLKRQGACVTWHQDQ